MTENFSQLVCVKQATANTELDVSEGRGPYHCRMDGGCHGTMSLKDHVHARTSVEANCLFLLVDCLPTL